MGLFDSLPAFITNKVCTKIKHLSSASKPVVELDAEDMKNVLKKWFRYFHVGKDYEELSSYRL